MKSILVKAFITAAGVFNLRALHLFGAITGKALYWLPNKARAVSRANIDRCFADKPPAYREQLLRASLLELGKWLFELAAIWRWPPRKREALVASRAALAALDESLRQGKGIMLIAPHYGNWELLGPIVAATRSLTVMYRPPEVPALDQFIRAARAGVGIALAGTDRKGLKTLIAALRQGQIIGILPDQAPKHGAYVITPFFNAPARTMTLFNKLLAKTQADAYLAAMTRLPQAQGFRLICDKLDTTRLAAPDEEKAARYLNQQLERLITEDPAQYLWSYKRFKFAPGERAYP